MRVGLLVPTLNAGSSWVDWLGALAHQTLQPDACLIVDSSSSDETVHLAREAGHQVVSIAKAQFDHGGTRQLGVMQLADCDVVVCMTQDAILADPDSLAKLIHPFHDELVAVTYGRQLPAANANPLATHARLFNYPPRSSQRSLANRGTLGLKAAFCSNSFAAWRTSALLAAGGFPSRVLLAEDMQAASKLLLHGYTLRYIADATVYHSHNYRAIEEFRRYFDIGASHLGAHWMLDTFGRVEGEGLRFLRSEWQYLRKHGLKWRTRSLIHTFMKLLGYKLGLKSRHVPISWIRLTSMHPNWWRNDNTQ